MIELERIPVLVYDDGTPGAIAAMDRATLVASAVVVASDHDSPNRAALTEAAERAGLALELVGLDAHSGIRHAVALCGERGLLAAFVPHPGEHPGELLRKCIQAVAQIPDPVLPALAVDIVPSGPARPGPIVEVARAGVEAGYAALFAAGLAITTRSELAVLTVGAPTDAEPVVRAVGALMDAGHLIAEAGLKPRYVSAPLNDPGAVARASRGARAVVVGLGGFEVHGHKLTAPDELPDSVLETPDGRIAHELAREAATDVIVVIDAVTTRRGAHGSAKAAPNTTGLAAVTSGLRGSAS